MAKTSARFDLPGFGGQLLHPGDAEYDEARRLFNGMIDRKPALIARCSNTRDVVAAVNLAREQSLPLAVHGGGHGVTGAAMCDDGVVIDLRGMKNITVDPKAKIAHADAGLNWGEFDAATQEHGLACTGGRVTTTGIAGLALGSGSGWLERKFGFVCDNLIAAEVVTADGRVVTASADENADLFWALRGGGGNFGVVTRFDLRLYELGPIVYGGMLVFLNDNAAELVKGYRDFIATAPDEVGSGMAFICAPPEEFVPQDFWGHPVIGIVCCYAGKAEDGPAAYQPLVDLGPIMNMLQPMPYVAVQQLLDGANPKGRLNYWTADFLEDLPDKAIDALVELATQPVSVFSQMLLIPGGGAISRVDEDETAFGQRNAPWNTHFLSAWEDPAETDKNIAYTREIAGAMKPWTTGRAYLNFIGDEGEGRVEAAYGPEKFKKLRELKKKWDPNNLFSRNQNIPPAK